MATNGVMANRSTVVSKYNKKQYGDFGDFSAFTAPPPFSFCLAQKG